jgi:hypothetical protein
MYHHVSPLSVDLWVIVGCVRCAVSCEVRLHVSVTAFSQLETRLYGYVILLKSSRRCAPTMVVPMTTHKTNAWVQNMLALPTA